MGISSIVERVAASKAGLAIGNSRPAVGTAMAVAKHPAIAGGLAGAGAGGAAVGTASHFMHNDHKSVY